MRLFYIIMIVGSALLLAHCANSGDSERSTIDPDSDVLTVTATVDPTATVSAASQPTSTVPVAPDPTPEPSPTPALSSASPEFDVLLPLNAENPTYPGFRAHEIAHHSLRLFGDEDTPQSATPAPPMNGCGARYYVLRFRTIGAQDVVAYIGGPANVNASSGMPAPPLEKLGVVNAGVVVLGGCSAALFETTEGSSIVEIVAQQTTYIATAFAPGTPTVPSPSTPMVPTPTVIPAPSPTPTTVAIVQIGDPRWWITPFAEGFGNTNEGKLYFGALLENHLDTPVRIGVSFRAYEADGTPFPGCHMPGGEGPGVYVNIAPQERALTVCQRSIVPRTTTDLQITARLWDATPLVAPPVDYEIIESGFDVAQKIGNETIYEPWTLVRASGSRDTTASLIFRLYSADNIQVATCLSDEVRLEPEIAQRVTCLFNSGILLDAGSSEPVTVRVDPVSLRP